MTPLQFKEFYKNNCNDYVCDKYNIALCCMYRLIKDFNITLTLEEKRARNKIATAQKVNMRYNITTGNIYSDPELKEYFVNKIRGTCLSRFGKDNYFKTAEFKEKSKKTCLQKYGTEYVSQSKEIQDKKVENNFKKYGVSSASKLEVVKQKQRDSIIRRFGTFEKYVEHMQEKRKQTCLSKYGVESPSQSKVVQYKTRQTCLEKYGVPYSCMTDRCRKYSGNNSHINEAFSHLFEVFFKDVRREFRLENYSYDFKINRYLIEIDPSITHNSTISVFKNTLPKDKYYHQNKSKVAQKYGYRCVHIFDWMMGEAFLKDLIYEIKNSKIPLDTTFEEPRCWEVDLKHCEIFPQINDKNVVLVYDDGCEDYCK